MNLSCATTSSGINTKGTKGFTKSTKKNQTLRVFVNPFVPFAFKMPCMARTSSMMAASAAATFAVSSAAPVVLCPPIRRIATFHLNSLSDLLFSLPALHSLREGFPGAHICAVLRPGLAALLENSPLVDEILLRPKGGVSAQAALMARLTTHHFDIALAFSQSRQCSLLAFSTRAPVRLGYQGAKMDALLTHHIAPDGPFTIEGALDFVRALGCPVHQYDYCGLVQPSPMDNKAADALLEARGMSGEFLLAACAGVERKYDRRALGEWSTEKWIETLRELSPRWPIALVGSRAMPGVAQAIGGQVYDFGGKTTLPVLAALCGKAKLVLGADSGVLHLAAALKTPVVGIYGPTDWQQTGPRGVPHRIVRHPVECSPCLLTKCKWTGADERKCLTQIAPNAVVRAVRDLIGL